MDAMEEPPGRSDSNSCVPFHVALLSGASAGMAVDISLFPLDTIKTRLQSPHGFLRSGGFRGVYSGLSATALGSAPGAALFFSTYEWSKARLASSSSSSSDNNNNNYYSSLHPSLVHMMSSSFGEIMACLVRVPTEVVKQRMQVQQGGGGLGSMAALAGRILASEGPRGFYTGFSVTLMREIPFSAIQFPIFEALKLRASLYWNQHHRASTSTSASSDADTSASTSTDGSVPAWASAACGSVAGAIAAAVTTPLDVAKTRIMIGKDASGVRYSGLFSTLRRVYAEGGGRVSALFAGVQPRVMWISIGGFVFFGTYEFVKNTLIRVV